MIPITKQTNPHSTFVYSLHFVVSEHFHLFLQLLLASVQFFFFPLSGSTEIHLEELSVYKTQQLKCAAWTQILFFLAVKIWPPELSFGSLHGLLLLHSGWTWSHQAGSLEVLCASCLPPKGNQTHSHLHSVLYYLTWKQVALKGLAATQPAPGRMGGGLTQLLLLHLYPSSAQINWNNLAITIITFC